MKRNYYEILQLDSDTIKWMLFKNQDEAMEKRKDNLIESMYNKDMKICEYARKNAKNPKKIKEIEDTIKELEIAYLAVRTAPLREIYNEELNKLSRKKERPLIDETAYDFFKLSEKSLKLYPENRANAFVKVAFDEITQKCEEAMRQCEEDGEKSDVNIKDRKNIFRRMQKIETLLSKAKQYYQLIETPEKRIEYSKLLDEQEEKNKIDIKRKEIKEKYSKANYFDEGLIETITTNESSKEKKVLRKVVEKISCAFLYGDRDIQLIKTGEVAFGNATGALESYVNEYKVIRKYQGKEKEDVIYTDLDFSELEVDEITGKPLNPDYYNCVLNKLLSEEAIEGSKYNGGYIGLIEKTASGDYDTTLDKETLSVSEQEMLTAVMLVQKRKEETKKEVQGEDTGWEK